MNDFQTKLYNDLLYLTNINEAFFFKDQILDGCVYRVFSYRLASYSDFLSPNALECRGIMFKLLNNTPVELSALPMMKFFNVNENPFTMDLDFNDIIEISLKMDGSLMSTYLHLGELRIKSKTALESEHAINAMNWLNLPKNIDFKQQLFELTVDNKTVNLEYTSPEPRMRIVVGYQEPRLTILNVRNKTNGSYCSKYDIPLHLNEIIDHWVDLVFVNDGPSFVDSITNMVGIEGYVIQLPSGLRVKKKTLWYCALHKSKDNVSNPKNLFNCVLDETTDDLRNLFCDDQYSLRLITEMEEFAGKIYNHLVNVVENFYEINKHLDRKEYAIKGQTELNNREFTLAMLKYTNKSFSYKEMMKKWYKEFGVLDKPSSEIVE